MIFVQLDDIPLELSMLNFESSEIRKSRLLYNVSGRVHLQRSMAERCYHFINDEAAVFQRKGIQHVEDFYTYIFI